MNIGIAYMYIAAVNGKRGNEFKTGRKIVCGRFGGERSFVLFPGQQLGVGAKWTWVAKTVPVI